MANDLHTETGKPLNNTQCPNYESHWQNACDTLFPGQELLTADQDDQAIAYAEAEYAACEGH